MNALRACAAIEELVDPSSSHDKPMLRALDAYTREALPSGRGRELERRAEFPAAELSALRTYRLVHEFVPAENGGALEWSRAMRLAARLAAHDLDVTLCLGGAVLGAIPVLVAGSAAQRAQYFDALRAGEMGALALSEWNHGSDLLGSALAAAPIDVNGLPVSVEQATHFRLDGVKAPINNGTRAANIVVLARTGEERDVLGQSLFLVGRDTAGLAPHAPFASLGYRCMDLSGAIFSGAVVPRSALMGRAGDGFMHVRRSLEISRSGVAAMAFGATTAAFGLAYAHGRARTLYGAPIARLGGVQAILARTFANALVAGALVRYTARCVGRSPTAARALSCAAKLVVPRLLEQNVAEAGTLLGARSLMEDLPFASLRRAAPVLAIFDGSSQLQLDELWRHAGLWARAGTLTPSRADECLRELEAEVPLGAFDPHAECDALVRETSPPAMLAALDEAHPTIGLRPFAQAADRLAVLASTLRGAPQAVLFRTSEAAGSIHALTTLAQAATRHERMKGDHGERAVVLQAALAFACVDAATSLAVTFSALAGVAPEAAHSAAIRESARTLLEIGERSVSVTEDLYGALRGLGDEGTE